jgi:hypothetical protein
VLLGRRAFCHCSAKKCDDGGVKLVVRTGLVVLEPAANSSAWARSSSTVRGMDITGGSSLGVHGVHDDVRLLALDVTDFEEDRILVGTDDHGECVGHVPYPDGVSVGGLRETF